MLLYKKNDSKEREKAFLKKNECDDQGQERMINGSETIKSIQDQAR